MLCDYATSKTDVLSDTKRTWTKGGDPGRRRNTAFVGYGSEPAASGQAPEATSLDDAAEDIDATRQDITREFGADVAELDY